MYMLSQLHLKIFKLTVYQTFQLIKYNNSSIIIYCKAKKFIKKYFSDDSVTTQNRFISTFSFVRAD